MHYRSFFPSFEGCAPPCCSCRSDWSSAMATKMYPMRTTLAMMAARAPAKVELPVSCQIGPSVRIFSSPRTALLCPHSLPFSQPVHLGIGKGGRGMHVCLCICVFRKGERGRSCAPPKSVSTVRKYDPMGTTIIARVKARSFMMTALLTGWVGCVSCEVRW